VIFQINWLFLFYSTVLTIVNKKWFDYLNEKVTWEENSKKKRLIVGALGGIVLTIIGIFFIRMTITVVFENNTLLYFFKNEKGSEYLVSLLIAMIVSLFFMPFIFIKIE